MKTYINPFVHRCFTLLCGVGLLSGFAAQPLQAQDDAQPGKKFKPMMHGPKWSKIQSELGLTDEQVAELEEISKDHRAEAMEVREDSSLSREQKRAKMKELRTSGKEEVDSVLTAEQREKLEQVRARKMQKIKEHIKGRAPSLDEE